MSLSSTEYAQRVAEDKVKLCFTMYDSICLYESFFRLKFPLSNLNVYMNTLKGQFISVLTVAWEDVVHNS